MRCINETAFDKGLDSRPVGLLNLIGSILFLRCGLIDFVFVGAGINDRIISFLLCMFQFHVTLGHFGTLPPWNATPVLLACTSLLKI